MSACVQASAPRVRGAAPRVVLLDSGGANLGSVRSALARLDVDAPVTSDWATIRAATHVLLPGVGAAGAAMARLRANGLDGQWVYFVHGYAAPASTDSVATVTHGESFSAVARRGNVMGVQFHPERSAAAGRRLLRNFLECES